MSQIETIKEIHSQGQYKEAIEGYQRILASEPNNDEAHFGMAHANSQLQQYELALEHAKQAVNLSPNSDIYLQFKGQMLLANQQVDESVAVFKQSLRENPNLFYSYLALGDIYTAKYESKKAKENYKLALRVHQDGIPAMIKLSRLLLLEGDYVGAEDLLQKAELQFPENPNLKLQMGIMRLEKGEQGFAELYFKKLLENEPNNHVAKAYLGISLLQSDSQKAHQLITELLNAKVQIPELMIAVGMSYVNNKNYQQALRYLLPICQSGGAYPSWLMALAQAYIGNHQPNSAMEVLNEVLKRGDNSRALIMLGHIHQVNNSLPTAIEKYRRVSKDSKDYNQSLLLQAECHYVNEDYVAVINQLEPLLADKPDHNAAVKLNINALSKLGEYDQALDLINSIDSKKQLKEFNQLMHFYAGLLLDEKQQYDQAWQHFSAIEPTKPFEIELLNANEEKTVQQFTTSSDDSVFKFVFTDRATGHHDFVNCLINNNITPLVDRFTQKARGDVFSDKWTIKMLENLNEAQIHFFRKKYTKKLKKLVNKDIQMVVDIMPLLPINLAIIKRIFPQAQVLLLSRNFADLRLHNRVFGSHQVHYLQFSKVVNQMVAMNPNMTLVDIDAWQNQDKVAKQKVEKVFGIELKPFSLVGVKPLERLMFPFMHWKNYKQQLNELEELN